MNLITYLCHINDNVAGAVDGQHEVVPPGELVSPGGPVVDGPILEHLDTIKEKDC